MTSTHLFKAPFSSGLVALSDAQTQALMKKAESGEVQSLDHVNLRMHAVSDIRGFLKTEIRLKRDDFFCDEDDVLMEFDSLADILGESFVRGVRGVRAVLLDQSVKETSDGDFIVTAWIGRNVWFNTHRMTAGYPANEEQTSIVLEDIADRMEYEFDDGAFVEIREKGESISREEARRLIQHLNLASLNAHARLSDEGADAEKIITQLLQDVDDWAMNAETAVHD